MTREFKCKLIEKISVEMLSGKNLILLQHL